MGSILYEVNDHIGKITLNRPEVMNCLNLELLNQLGEQLEAIHTNKEIRVVIITGYGPKAFCAGADLKERKTLNEHEVRRNVKKIGDVFSQIANLPQPTIAAINGFALGGGLELALACDFRLAVSSAMMGLPETSMAIIPGAGGTQRLPRLIGEAKAMELILTARRLSASEALGYGMLNQVVEADQLIEASEEFARRIMKNGPIAVQQAKFAIRNGINVDLETGLKLESKAYELTIPTKDRVEALKAFGEKRASIFKGE